MRESSKKTLEIFSLSQTDVDGPADQHRYVTLRQKLLLSIASLSLNMCDYTCLLEIIYGIIFVKKYYQRAHMTVWHDEAVPTMGVVQGGIDRQEDPTVA